jgi:hypothetical protein
MKTKLYDLNVRNLQPREKTYLEWDAQQNNFGVRVYPTGKKVFYCIYSFKNKVRFYPLGDVAVISLANARKEALNVMHRVVVKREDPAADRALQRGKLTFAAVAERYVAEHAKHKNKSWKTAAPMSSGTCCQLGATLRPTKSSAATLRNCWAH